MRLLIVLFACLCLGGCGRMKRTGECRDFAKTVNAGLDEIATAADAGPDAGGSDAELAKKYEALSEKVRAYSFSSDGVEKAKVEYADLMHDTARALKERHLAQDANDRVGTARAARTFIQIQRRQKMLIARIDSLCESP